MREWLSRVAFERAVEDHPEHEEVYRKNTWRPDSGDLAEHVGDLQCRIERLERADELRTLRPRRSLIGRAKRALVRLAILTLTSQE